MVTITFRRSWAGKEEIYKGLIDSEGVPDTAKPDYQVGEACLVDQLLGQYMAHIAGLGYLLDEEHVKQALRSIFRNNYKPDMSEHEAVQRTYALNDEAAVVVASYPRGKRPEIPFPYFAEAWTGEEYQFAAHLVYEGMVAEGATVAEGARLRHDGERRNPWNEPECGHHYARAMSSWALIVALGGFHYSAVDKALTLAPRLHAQTFRCFWSVPSGWAILKDPDAHGLRLRGGSSRGLDGGRERGAGREWQAGAEEGDRHAG